VKRLGQGTFGAAYLATKAGSTEQLAAKLALREIEPEDQVSFMRELSILANNQHPATLRLLGFSLTPYPDRDEQGPVIITPWMTNDSLDKVLKRARSPPEWWTPTVKSKIVFGIAAGMAYVHQQGVMHRDLKPENIFLDANYEPVIADFGLSRAIDPSGMAATVGIGSPIYMAPEIIRLHDAGDASGPKYDFRVDVYSYAMILYAMFNPEQLPSYDRGGKPRNIADLTKHVCGGRRYAKLKDIPDYYWTLIERCWTHGWESRPQFSDIVEEMRATQQYALPGANLEELKQYEERMVNFAPEPPASNMSGSNERRKRPKF
jgi:serine/threonine protein kinase